MKKIKRKDYNVLLKLKKESLMHSLISLPFKILMDKECWYLIKKVAIAKKLNVLKNIVTVLQAGIFVRSIVNVKIV